jgi:hypothetical protein
LLHQGRDAVAQPLLRQLRPQLAAVERLDRQLGRLKYQGFGRNLICYKGISFFLTYLNSRLFVCSK